MRRPVLLRWGASNYFGWGILGLNLLQRWALDADLQPLLGMSVAAQDLQGIDPLKLAALASAVAASNRFQEELPADREIDLRQLGLVVINALGNGLTGRSPRIRGFRNVGRCIFENTRTSGSRNLEHYDALLCASHWSASVLRTMTDKPVTMIHEGIEHSQFFPGPRSGALGAGRFFVFSGGKIEFRKAHDLVILAFREFAARHDDAVLVAAWNSPWPEISTGFRGKLPVALQRGADGTLDIQRWVRENGIRPQQFMELPPMPNSLLPMVLREMDCAVQASRCEACTNLPAKEAMACGVPVILANNTGTLDLVDLDNCIALRSQGPVTAEPGWGTEGWGESSVEEIVAALERLYTDTQVRRRIGERGAAWILEHQRTWAHHAALLKAYVLGLV
jgi:glycosyltransferase involved in cell wall biosynthesis